MRDGVGDRSAYTYRRHQGAVTCVSVLENSHTVVSGSDDGAVHAWRLDHIADGQLSCESLPVSTDPQLLALY